MNGTHTETSTCASASGEGHLIYLYSIVEGGTEAHRLLEERRIPGLEPEEPLFAVEAAGLVAAVSRVPGAMFQEDSLNALMRELPSIAPFAIRHDEVVRTLLPAAPAIVPITLGAVYKSTSNVAGLLQRREDEFRSLLANLRGKAEWGFKVFRDGARFLEATGENSPRLRQLDEEAAQSSPGRAYLIRRQRERLLASESEVLMGQSIDTMLQALAGVSDDMRVDQLPDEQPGPVFLVFKASFLVESARVEAFRSAVAGIQRSVTDLGLRLELNGPWAPYSFVVGQANQE